MSKIRLCVDGTPLLLRSAGVKTYTYYWIQGLIRTAGSNDVSLFPFLSNLGECVHERSILGRVPTLARIALVQAANYLGSGVLSWMGGKIDVFHASNQLRNPPRSVRLTTTLHDMTCWLVPETHSPANVAATKKFAAKVFRRADALISVSECSRQDAIRILDLKPEKIEVIYPGVADSYFEVQPEGECAVAARYGLTRPYLLFVGTVEPRKNISALLDAYQQLSPSLRSEFDLVVVGSVGWGDTGVLNRLRSGEAGVHYLGYVPEEDLPGLTSRAAIFVYPSLYEGFGLPVGQAMAAGVPIVTSNISSLPEVAQDSAILVDPRSPGEIRGAVEKLLLSPSLRAKLGSRGVELAQRFRWETCARRSWEMFERLCS